MGGIKVNESGQQAWQHPQVGFNITVHQISGRISLKHRQPRCQRCQAVAQKNNRIGSSAGSAERPSRIADRHKALVCAFQVAQRIGRFGGHFAVTQPVRDLWPGTRGLGQCKNPVLHHFGPSLADKAFGVRNQQTQCFLPRARIDELGNGGIGLAMGCQHVGSLQPQSPQRWCIQVPGSARAQKLAKQRVEGVGRGCRLAAVGEQAAPCQIRQQIRRLRITADGNGHGCRGTWQKCNAH